MKNTQEDDGLVASVLRLFYSRVMAGDTVSRRMRSPGRGATGNRAGRFDLQRESFCDGWPEEDDLPVLRTEVSRENCRSLVSYNRSPDLPFDRSINPYRGCEHGCAYCFARPSHAFLGLSPGLDFETRLIARTNAAKVLEQELRARRYKVAPIAIGTNTDPYQPIEKKFEITRSCLDVLTQFHHPVAIVTKGALIERDLDILAPMARAGLVRVGVSITTLDADLSRRMEPRAPSPRRRLQIIRSLSDAGVPVRVMIAPVVPGLSDHELEALLDAAAGAGAQTASWIMLRLPREVSQLWQDWLAEHAPGHAGRVMARLREMHGGKDYDARWGHRMRGQGVHAQVIATRFRLAARRLGLDREVAPLRCDLFRPPARAGDQLSLF